VSFAGSTLVLFNIADLRNGQSCSESPEKTPKWERTTERFGKGHPVELRQIIVRNHGAPQAGDIELCSARYR
jgi:hypothetical protein